MGAYKDRDRGGNWTHDLPVRLPLLYWLSYKVRQEKVVGTEDVKVTAIMNMYKYKNLTLLVVAEKFWKLGGRLVLVSDVA